MNKSDNVTRFQELIETAKKDEETHVLTVSNLHSLAGLDSYVAIKRSDARIWFDIATTIRDLDDNNAHEIITQLVAAADACGVTLVMRQPGGQEARSLLRTWMHKTFGFQDDEDGCWLERQPGGVPTIHNFGGFDKRPQFAPHLKDEVDRLMSKSRPVKTA